MSEKLFRFFLSEVKKLRLVCQNPSCGSATEVSLSRLRHGDVTHECRVCGTRYFPKLDSSSLSPLARLAAALEDLEERTENLKVELAVPDRD